MLNAGSDVRSRFHGFSMTGIPAFFNPWFRRYSALPALLVLLLQLWLPAGVLGNSCSLQTHELQPTQVASPFAGAMTAVEESRDLVDKYFFVSAVIFKKFFPCPAALFFGEAGPVNPGKTPPSYPFLSRPPPNSFIYSAGF